MRNMLGSKGDTIVEVLLAILIVGSVLTGAYVSANRSLNATRQSQERGEALKLAEEQLERIKSHGKSSSSPIYSASTLCVNNSNTVINPYSAASCDITLGGVTYKRQITRSVNIFTNTITWDRVGGGSTETSKLVYKLYQP